MFFKNKSVSVKDHTLIGIGASIHGNITSEGKVRIDGKFNGNVDSREEVILGESASIIGDITSKNVIIYGLVNGNIISSGLLEIMPTGKLYGDIEVKNVSIQPGAIFQGKSSMKLTKEDFCNEEVAVD